MRVLDWRRLLPSCLTDSKLSKLFTLLYLATFLIMLPLICYDLRHSIYNFRRKGVSAEMDQMKQDNDKRLSESRRIITEYKTSMTSHSQSDSLWQPRVTRVGITVITVSRNRNFKDGYKPQYLTQVVGRMLHLINVSKTGLKYDIFVCNVDNDPQPYEEALSFKSIFTVFHKYKARNESSSDIFEKEKLDYIFCIEATMKQNVSFAFMIEDDAYPHQDLLPVLENIIGFTGKKRMTNTSNVTFVKFYHPERLLGYISLEVERLPELIAFSFVFGTLLSILCFHCFASSERNYCLHVWIKSVIYFGLIALVVGRVNLIELRRMSVQMYQLTPPPFCCTQAMLFPADGARRVVSHLKETTCSTGYGKDAALDDIWRRENYKALMVQPNLFTHNGLYSTVRRRMINPFLLE